MTAGFQAMNKQPQVKHPAEDEPQVEGPDDRPNLNRVFDHAALLII